MARITVGLDFGTHQTKICVEDRSDVSNPIYSFFSFEDLDGNRSVLLPSIVQVNRDNTLSYGFVDSEKAKYDKKFYIGEMPEFPQKPTFKFEEVLDEPIKPNILRKDPPKDSIGLSRYKDAEKSYESQMVVWNQKKIFLEARNNQKKIELEKAYKEAEREWYKWQNSSQINYRLVYRYFKQSTFSNYNWKCTQHSTSLSIWYLSYVIFLLEKQYGQDFSIQMGIPTGSDNFAKKKKNAVSILLSAYRLVEEVFNNDLDKFLATPINELEKLTQIVPYSDDKKYEYGILIFPEAYAGLSSITSQGKIPEGMSLMVDIGGGTTDVTFFTIEENRPRIYDYFSIPFGINYIIETALPELQDKFEANLDLNEIEKDKLKKAITQYKERLLLECENLLGRLSSNFERTGFSNNRLIDALKNRIVVYSGGGSTYDNLRTQLSYFKDIRHVSSKIWEGLTINELDQYKKYTPILSTALGLSISQINDDIVLSSVSEIFSNIENQNNQLEDHPRPRWV
jgi:hypothetical protein